MSLLSEGQLAVFESLANYQMFNNDSSELARSDGFFVARSPSRRRCQLSPLTAIARLTTPPHANPLANLSRLGAGSLSGFCGKKTYSCLQLRRNRYTLAYHPSRELLDFHGKNLMSDR